MTKMHTFICIYIFNVYIHVYFFHDAYAKFDVSAVLSVTSVKDIWVTSNYTAGKNGKRVKNRQ